MGSRRFGGAYSPGAGASDQRPASRTAAPDFRAILLFVLPTPLLLAIFGAMSAGAPLRLVVLIGAYVGLILGAWLLREGQKAEAEYNARDVARPPAFPRKIAAALLAGFGVAAASLVSEHPIGVFSFLWHVITAAVFGLLATGAHLLAFGLDPTKPKGMGDGISAYEAGRVADAVNAAEEKLAEIEKNARNLEDDEIEERVTALNTTVREMIAMVEEDPRDLDRARRYLGTYLNGAADATRKYAASAERLNDPAIREEFLSLLADLDASFGRGKALLTRDDRTDLEVEIEVLRERLDQESP